MAGNDPKQTSGITELDGEIDYSKYGTSELVEARATIDSTKYPKNFANLEAAIARLQRDIGESDVGNAAEEEPSIWATLDGPDRYRSLPPRETAQYVVIFILFNLSVAFAFEYLFVLLGWSVGSIVRVVYYSLAVVPVGVLFTRRHRRMPTANEFTGLAATTYGSYVLIGLLLAVGYFNFVGEFPEISGWVIPLSIPFIGIAFLIDILLFYFAFRFPMRWTMILCLKERGQPRSQ